MNKDLYLRSVGETADAHGQMKKIGVCPEGTAIMLPKMRHFVLMARGLDPRAANILKQEMLAVGGEAAISYHTICDLSRPTDCLISGTERQLCLAREKLKIQPFGLAELSLQIGCAVQNLTRREKRNFGRLEIGSRTLVMGIINITPDSFSGDGTLDIRKAVEKALSMESHGAHIIDVGGESTRPGAKHLSADEESKRTIPVIKELAKKLNIPISIDSRNPKVVEKAIEAGAGMVNLVGGIRNKRMADVLAKNDIPVILMHMQGEPGTMQQNPTYADVVDDIISDLRCQIAFALESGIQIENIAIDPGIGFGKTLEHNLEILRRLDEFRIIGLPIVVGTSRKSFIGKVLDAEVDDRLEGSLASAVLASARGADIVRAHDVKETSRVIRMADAIAGKGN